MTTLSLLMSCGTCDLMGNVHFGANTSETPPDPFEVLGGVLGSIHLSLAYQVAVKVTVYMNIHDQT